MNTPEPGAFSDSRPWTVIPETMRWREGIDALRERTQAQLPELVRRKGLPPLGRFVDAGLRIVSALTAWAFHERRGDASTSRSGLSRRLRLAFEKLGPAYINLCQIVSSGRGLFP